MISDPGFVTTDTPDSIPQGPSNTGFHIPVCTVTELFKGRMVNKTQIK